MPCFCGCEQQRPPRQRGLLRAVARRNGDVIEWEDHGLECAVCIDVATRSRQMYASGASVARHPRGRREGIRAATSPTHDADARSRRPRLDLTSHDSLTSGVDKRRRGASRGCSRRSTKACTSARSVPMRTSTIAANPHLKLIFGYPSETPEADVRPFDPERFVDPQARAALLERLATDGVGHRLPAAPAPRRQSAGLGRGDRRAPTRRPPTARCASRRSSATSASARSWTTRRATSITSCCRPRRWRRSARRSPASRTN